MEKKIPQKTGMAVISVNDAEHSLLITDNRRHAKISLLIRTSQLLCFIYLERAVNDFYISFYDLRHRDFFPCKFRFIHKDDLF